MGNSVRRAEEAFTADCRPRCNAEPGCSNCIKAHLRCRRLPHWLALAAHAGAGGVRSRAISDRMSANICRDTATSAIWILISRSLRLVSDHGSAAFAIASVRMNLREAERLRGLEVD